MPKMTLGILLYNAERYLGETPDSILIHTSTDFEPLIADNASTRGTDEICRNAPNERRDFRRSAAC